MGVIAEGAEKKKQPLGRGQVRGLKKRSEKHVVALGLKEKGKIQRRGLKRQK